MAVQLPATSRPERQSPGHRWTARRGLAAVALASTALATLPAAAAAGAARGPAASVVPRAVQDAGIVTLATGERVILDSAMANRPVMRVIPAARTGPAASLQTLRLGDDRYVIPGSARHYLGRYLDPSLFDVDRIAAAHLGDRLPVRLRYTGSAPALPGVTITSAAGGVATGYLTPASARTFGRALARQALADANAGWPATSALFAGVTSLAADVPASPVFTPAFPMVTLIIHAIGHDGLPVQNGFGILMNADDARKSAIFFLIIDGEARVSVPLGNYIGATEEDVFSDDGAITSRIALAVDYPVTAHLQTLTFDTRLATVSPSVTAPRPAVAADLELEIDVADAAGFGGFGFGFGIPPDQGRVLLPPTAPPAIGSLTQSTAWTLVDPSTAGGRYTYGSAYAFNGIPARHRHRIPSKGLASVRATYHADRAVRVGAAVRLPLLPGAFGAAGFFLPVPMPLQRTEFLDYPAGTLVLDTAVQDWTAFDPGSWTPRRTSWIQATRGPRDGSPTRSPPRCPSPTRPTRPPCAGPAGRRPICWCSSCRRTTSGRTPVRSSPPRAGSRSPDSSCSATASRSSTSRTTSARRSPSRRQRPPTARSRISTGRARLPCCRRPCRPTSPSARRPATRHCRRRGSASSVRSARPCRSCEPRCTFPRRSAAGCRSAGRGSRSRSSTSPVRRTRPSPR
jgi:hypothetical protein